MPPSNLSPRAINKETQREELRRLVSLYDMLGWENADPALLADDPIMWFRFYKATKDWYSMANSRWPRIRAYGLYKLGRMHEAYQDTDMRVGSALIDLLKADEKDEQYWRFVKKISQLDKEDSYTENSIIRKAQAEISVHEQMELIGSMEVAEVIKLLDSESPYIRVIAQRRLKGMEVQDEERDGSPTDF